MHAVPSFARALLALTALGLVGCPVTNQNRDAGGVPPGVDAPVTPPRPGLSITPANQVVTLEGGPIAIEYKKGHEFDFAARYTAEFVSLNRPDLPEEQIDRLGDVARQAHRTLGLRDVSRSDFIVSADGSFVVLETAITPGTTETSVFPFACTASGTTLGAVARDLLARAIEAGPPV